MNRSSGWVELVTRGHGRRARRERARILTDVRALVPAALGPPGAVDQPTLVLRECDGRWHLWVESAGSSQSRGLLPLFKTVGALAPASCGVLDLVGPTGVVERWVMTRGSVDLAVRPDPYRRDLYRVEG